VMCAGPVWGASGLTPSCPTRLPSYGDSVSRLPTPVRAALITSDCPRGTLSISDLELTATIAHKDVLVQHRATQERTLWIASDNRAAVSWGTKGSSTASSARAYLLRLNAYHQRTHRYVARLHYMPGPVNSMADDASRLWHLNDADLLTHFNLHYPQLTSWKLRTLEPTMDSALIGALSKKRRVPASLCSAASPLIPQSASGRPFVPILASPHASPTARPTVFPFSNCLPSATAPVPCPPAVAPCDLARWRTPYEVWARRSPGWGPRTLV
jgi:hypothetical protein